MLGKLRIPLCPGLLSSDDSEDMLLQWHEKYVLLHSLLPLTCSSHAKASLGDIGVHFVIS